MNGDICARLCNFRSSLFCILVVIDMLIQFKERAVLNTTFLGALEVEMCGENDRITKMPLTPSLRTGVELDDIG